MGERMMLKDALNLNSRSGILGKLVRIIRGTVMVELLGAILYSFRLVPLLGLARGLWASLFNSVSAFCNAGMDIIGPTSMGQFHSDPAVLLITMTLIVLGGLGYVVWFDISSGIKKGIKKKYSPITIIKRFTEHTKLVLTMTFSLIFLGALIIFFAEYNNPATIGTMSLSDKIINSFFQSITLRTAGFASFSQKGLTDISCVISYVLMFIGGSPVGTAGGIKTVTFFLAAINIINYINCDEKNLVFHKRVTEDLMRKASVILAVSSFTVIVLTLILLATNPAITVVDSLFEVISASATVGLTRDVTPTLNLAGRIIIIIAMYLGRIGPISMAIFFANRKPNKNSCKFAEGEFYVG